MSPRKLADRRQRRMQKGLFIGCVAVLALYAVFFGDHRPYHLGLLYLEERRTEDRIVRLRAERDTLEAELAGLETDPVTLERLAREKGLIRPGDLVYRIVPVSADVRRAAAESLAIRAARRADSLARDSLAMP